MTKYSKPLNSILIEEYLPLVKNDTAFTKQQIVEWLDKHYPGYAKNTVSNWLDRMTTNAPSRLNWPIRKGKDDVFYKHEKSNSFRLYDQMTDPPPIYSHTAPIEDELFSFEESFDTSFEDKAVRSREQFLRDFPLNRLTTLTLDEYVIGKGTASFCSHVEAKTKEWAAIQGSTAIKFGIYYGKTKSDSTMQYRFSKKFGKSQIEAFNSVKNALIDLTKAGFAKDFVKIDANPLSSLFKAKIISLYFPDSYINICGPEYLEGIALELGIPESDYYSKLQHLIFMKKLENPITKFWSNPKYMLYLCEKFKRSLNDPSADNIRKPQIEVPDNQFADPFSPIQEEEQEVLRSERLVQSFERNQEVRRRVRERAQGKCELCKQVGFNMADGRIYIETHHVIPLSEGGADREYNVVALCPNHHREAHHGSNRKEMRESMLRKLLVNMGTA